ncbi:MAG: DUF4386 domain-containing protein [Candidatus Neomarinimicrobiota bacterium]
MNTNKTTARRAATSPLFYARAAGLVYLIALPFMVFSFAYVSSTLIVPGDAAATANNIMASEGLFRSGIVSWLIGQTVFMLLPLVLYKLLKPVNKSHAVLMVIFLLVSVPIAFINELNQFAVLFLLSGADYLTAFEVDQLHAQVMLFLDLHEHGILIAGIFWGLWLLPLGFLVLKSGFLPRTLGVLLIIGSFGYVLDSLTGLLFPDYKAIVSQIVIVPNFISEFALNMWLLIKGVNVEQWEKRALESA